MRVVLVIGAICLSSIPIALSLWALLDAASRPAWCFAYVRRSRTVWVALPFLGMFTLVGGLAVALWYLAKVRPRVRDVEAGRF